MSSWVLYPRLAAKDHDPSAASHSIMKRKKQPTFKLFTYYEHGTPLYLMLFVPRMFRYTMEDSDVYKRQLLMSKKSFAMHVLLKYSDLLKNLHIFNFNS